VLHQGVFQTGVTWRFTQKSDAFEVNCRTDVLLNRYKSWWNAAARRYIESKAPRLDIGAAVREHADAVLPLYEWYEERFYEYHYPTMTDFEASAARLREISAILEPGSMPPLDEPVPFTHPDRRRGPKPTPPRARAAYPKSKRKKKRRKAR
jgi:hypothetical protein